MHQRCYNPRVSAYKYYGARGITVCPRWHDFLTFMLDVAPRPSPHHTIDRINNDGNYEPSNIRWATMKQQAKNKRPSGPHVGAGLPGLLDAIHAPARRRKKIELEEVMKQLDKLVKRKKSR